MENETLESRDSRIGQILSLMQQLGSGNLQARETPSERGDDLDEIISGLNVLAQRFSAQLTPLTKTEQWLDKIMEVIIAIASLDFTRKMPIGDEGNVFDAVGVGLNALSEELFASTISRDYLDSIINSIGDAVIATDAEGKVTRLNPVAEELTGWMGKEAEGKHLSEVFNIVNAKTRETAVNPVTQVLESGKIVGLANHTMLIAKDGTEYQIADSAAPIRNSDGNITGVVMVFRNVTEEYYMKEMLRDSGERYRRLFDLLPYGAEVIDLEGNIIECNPHTARMLGYERDELIGKHITEILAPSSIEIFRQKLPSIAKGIAKENIESADIKMMHTNGSIIDVLRLGRPIYDAYGKISNYLSVNVDITERKRAEEERERFALQLSIASDIATQINAILDPDKLLNAVISLIKERFGLYYAHVYTLEETMLKLRSGYGEAGKKMLAEGHAISLDSEISLVARAAWRKEIVVVHDVAAAPDFLPNLLLPDTKSEVAVPLLIGERVLGVFDVQHDETDRFTQADLDVFNTLGGQIATALQNASLFEALRESEEKYRTLVEYSSDFIFLIDNEGVVLSVNQAAARSLGRKPQDVPGKNVSELFPPEIAGNYKRSLKKIFETGTSIANEVVMPAGGEVLWISSSLNPVKDKAGEVVAVLGVSRDITERKQAQELLQESEENLRATLNSIGDAVIATDTQGNVTRLNPVAETLTGWLLSEAGGKPLSEIFDIVNARTRETAVNPVTQVLKSGKIVGLANHTMLIAKDGTEYQISDSAAPIWDADGNIIGVVLVFRDVTEEYRMRETLGESEARNRAILNAIPDLMFVFSKDGTFIDYHATSSDLLYAPPEQFLGKKLRDVFSPELAAPFLHLIKQTIMTEQTQIYEYSLPMDGLQHHFEARLVFYGQDRVLSITQNVTERKNMQEMTVQSEKMLSVGGLAAGMAHEINNPLAGMMQTANVMNNRLTNIDMLANQRAAEEAGIPMESIRTFMESRGIPRMLAAINQSGRRIAKIVDNMLSFSRKSDAVVSTHDMVELLDRTVSLAATDYDLKKQYDFKTIEIVKEYEADLPLVPCEGVKIQQVFLNILRNGAQAMQEAGGKPRFVLRLARETELGMLRIEIEDNGAGMDETTRKRAFEPFFTTKPVGVGTGLGLSVSYFIVSENHGGEMEVVSEPGKGATFIIRLPVERIGTVP